MFRNFNRMVLAWVALLGACGLAGAQLPQGDLVAEYLFNGDAVDTSGNGHHGTVVGATLTTDRFGHLDRAYRFDGSGDQYIDISTILDSLIPASPSIGTVSLWFNASRAYWQGNSGLGAHYGSSLLHSTTLAGPPSSGQSLFIGHSTFYSGTESILWQTYGRYNLVYEEGHGFFYDDLWHHVVAVVGADHNRIYIDGTPVGGRYVSGAAAYLGPDAGGFMWTEPSKSTLQSVQLGRNRDTVDTSAHLLGAIDDVRIYGRALTDADVVALYEELPPPVYVCDGFLPPMARGTVTARGNRALPLKARLLDANGYPITDLDLMAPPVVQVLFESVGGGGAVDVSQESLPAGAATDGNEFEYNAGDAHWQFNLKTRGYTSAGIYRITVVSGDQSEYTIDPTCMAAFERLD